MDLKHAELVPETDLHKPTQETFYLPMHAVHKDNSPQPNSELYLMPQQSPVLASLSMTAYMSGPLSILLSLMLFNGSVHTVLLSPQTLVRCIGLWN